MAGPFCDKFPICSLRLVLSPGSTSLSGPGSLVHLGSLKCIHPEGAGLNVAEGTKLVIRPGCSKRRYFICISHFSFKKQVFK